MRRSTSCNVAFSFGDKYACGLGTCQVVNLAVSQLAPEDIDIPWMLLLAQNSWATDTYIHTVSCFFWYKSGDSMHCARPA